MASLEDIKEWNAERGKHPPLRGNYTFGGMWVDAPLSFPATLDGSPDYPIRVMFSSLSSCHLFDHETFKRGKLHRTYPYKLNYKPYRPDIDNVVIRSFHSHGGDPMKIHAIASVPAVIEGMLFQAENVFLVDLAPQIQAVFSMTLLDDYDMDGQKVRILLIMGVGREADIHISDLGNRFKGNDRKALHFKYWLPMWSTRDARLPASD